MSNSFSYKNFKLNTLIEAKVGGEVYSLRDAYMNEMGTSIQSLDGRAGGICGA